MKTMNTHSTQGRKNYRKPVLKKIGTVAKLTREEKGSTGSDAPDGGFAYLGPVLS
ncbi:hypothetical protein DYBT9275_03959 [Dyadobacter sp. CECT 9275]|uniref:Lasso RiPP family leader peptide-containing protein n=1 Tax=Dyadobacter helix TaxID=2822344 RepID=A0A916NDB2_9BACT|nr:lasso RiPP family leader peptide-containing protein [Dyadobacter sp. CECT 9275]CAG5007078.1 hypothetical protein DYBT9275_03959 [Dyadobacter sp. CECT 9275]